MPRNAMRATVSGPAALKPPEREAHRLNPAVRYSVPRPFLCGDKLTVLDCLWTYGVRRASLSYFRARSFCGKACQPCCAWLN